MKYKTCIEYELNADGQPYNINIEKTSIPADKSDPNYIYADSAMLTAILMHNTYMDRFDKISTRNVSKKIFKDIYIDCSMMEFPIICEYWKILYEHAEETRSLL